MFVFLSKLLPLFVFPVGLACLLLVVALAWKRAWRPLVVLALVVLLSLIHILHNFLLTCVFLRV